MMTKLVFYPLLIFIYDSLNFGTAFHNSSQKSLTEVSTYLFLHNHTSVS